MSENHVGNWKGVDLALLKELSCIGHSDILLTQMAKLLPKALPEIPLITPLLERALEMLHLKPQLLHLILNAPELQVLT